MLIDSSAVINIPHDGELKTKKRQEAEEIKPVEKSGKGDEPELNIGRDRITGKTPEIRRFDTGNLYNKYGEMTRDNSEDEYTATAHKTIDVIV